MSSRKGSAMFDVGEPGSTSLFLTRYRYRYRYRYCGNRIPQQRVRVA